MQSRLPFLSSEHFARQTRHPLSHQCRHQLQSELTGTYHKKNTNAILHSLQLLMKASYLCDLSNAEHTQHSDRR